MKMFHRTLGALACAVFAGCSSGGTGPLTALPTASGTSSAAASVSWPAPLDPAQTRLQDLTRANIVGASASASAAAAALDDGTGDRAAASTVGAADARFEVGLGVRDTYPATAMYAVHSAFPADQFQLQFPAATVPDGTNPERLVAPLMVPPHSCLTSDVVYVNYGGTGTGFTYGAHSLYRIIDSCLVPRRISLFEIDASFVQAYVRPDPHTGAPSLVTSVLSLDAYGTANATWLVVLWNFSVGHWEVAAVSSGATPTPGLAVARSALFQPGSCPDIPRISEDNVQIYNSSTHRWAVADNTNSFRITPGTIRPWGSSKACFTAGGTSGASYVLDFVGNQHWSLHDRSPSDPRPPAL